MDVYDWKITWHEGNTTTTVCLRDKTEQEAYEHAELCGCEHPEWWQFWKRKPCFIRWKNADSAGREE